MAIAVAMGSKAEGSTGPVTVTLPAHATGDLLLLFAYQRASATALTVTTATGWTSIASVANASNGSMRAWYKKAASSSETNPVITGLTTANLSMIGYAATLTGADADNPIDTAGTSGTFAAPTTPFDVTQTAISTTNNNAAAFFMWGSLDNNGWDCQTATWTELAGAVGSISGDTALGTDAGTGLVYKVIATAGTTGSVVSRQTLVGGDAGAYLRFAIKEAAAPTPVNRDLQLLHHVRAAVGQSVQTKHHVLVPVGQSLQTKHNVAAPVGQSLQAKWDTLAPPGPTSYRSTTELYRTATAYRPGSSTTTVTRSLELDWKVTTNVGLSIRYRWDVLSTNLLFGVSGTSLDQPNITSVYLRKGPTGQWYFAPNSSTGIWYSNTADPMLTWAYQAIGSNGARGIDDDGTNFVFGNNIGRVYTATSLTGPWTLHGDTFSSATDDVRPTYVGGKWLILSEGGKVYVADTTDPTGTWTQATNPAFGSTAVYSAASDGTTWVIAGGSGKMAYATAANLTGTWTLITGLGSSAVNKVYYIDGTWYALSADGNIYATTDPTGAWTGGAYTNGYAINDFVFNPNDGYWYVGATLGKIFRTTAPTVAAQMTEYSAGFADWQKPWASNSVLAFGVDRSAPFFIVGASSSRVYKFPNDLDLVWRTLDWTTPTVLLRSLWNNLTTVKPAWRKSQYEVASGSYSINDIATDNAGTYVIGQSVNRAYYGTDPMNSNITSYGSIYNSQISVDYGGGWWAALSSTGNLMTTQNLASGFSLHGTSFGGGTGNKIRYLNGRWFICSDNGVVSVSDTSSPQGTWSSVDLTAAGWGGGYSVYDVGFDGTNYLAVGGNGSTAYATNPNGTWTYNDIGGTTIFSVAYGNGVWVLGHSDGSIARTTSVSGPWTLYDPFPTSSNFTQKVVFSGGLFWVAPNNGVRVAYSSDGITWTETTELFPGGVAAMRGHTLGPPIIASISDQYLYAPRDGGQQAHWAVRQLSGTKDVQAKWNVLAAVTRTLQTVWHVLYGAGLSAVGQALQQLWHTRATVGQSSRAPWNIRAAVGRAFRYPFNIRAAVGRAFRYPWNIYTLTTRSLQTLHNVRAAAGRAYRYPFNVAARTTRSLQQLWHIRSTTGSDHTSLWNLRQLSRRGVYYPFFEDTEGWSHTSGGAANPDPAVGYLGLGSLQAVCTITGGGVKNSSGLNTSSPGRDHAFAGWLLGESGVAYDVAIDFKSGGVSGSVTGTATYQVTGTGVWQQFSINGTAPTGTDTAVSRVTLAVPAARTFWLDDVYVWDATSLASKFNVRVAATQSLIARWPVRALAGQAVRAPWNTAAAVAKALQTPWHVRAVIARNLRPVWNVVGAITTAARELITLHHVRAAVGQSARAPWNIRSLVTRSLQQLWHVRLAVGRQYVYRWAVHSAVGRALTALWKIAVGRALRTLHNVRAAVGQPVRAPWNIRTLVTRSNTVLWNVRAAAGRAFRYPFNVATTTTRSLITRWPVATMVGQQIITRWKVAVTAGQSLITRWDVRAAVTRSLRPVWNVVGPIYYAARELSALWNKRALVTQQVRAPWNLRAAAGRVLQQLWHVRAAVGQSSRAPWNTLVTTTQSLINRWRVWVAVGRATRAPWNVRAAISRTVRVPWYVLTSVTRVDQLVWKVRAAVGPALRVPWNVRTMVGQAVITRWKVTVTAGQQLVTRWKVAAATGRALIARWDVRAAIGRQLRPLWNVAGPIVSAARELVSLWNQRALAAQSSTARWNVRAAVSRLVRAPWNVRTIIGRAVRTPWTVLTSTTRSLINRWNVRALAGTTSQWRWNVRANIQETLTATWTVLTTVNSPVELKWAVYAAAGNALITSWRVSAAVATAVGLRWKTLGARALKFIGWGIPI
jgi:hypothetical protein